MDGAHGGKAGVVDEDVDRQATCPDLVTEREARVRIGEVGCHHLGPHVTLFGQFVGQGAEPILAAGHQGDAVAPLGQVTRDLGADAIFIEAPESVAELEQIAHAIPGPKVANMVEHGKTPLLSPDELHQLGFDMIVTPLAGLLASAKALQEVYAVLRTEGTTLAYLDRLLPFDDFNQLVELERHYALEQRFK